MSLLHAPQNRRAVALLDKVAHGRSACGIVVSRREVSPVGAGVTCPACQAVLEGRTGGSPGEEDRSTRAQPPGPVSEPPGSPRPPGARSFPSLRAPGSPPGPGVVSAPGPLVDPGSSPGPGVAPAPGPLVDPGPAGEGSEDPGEDPGKSEEVPGGEALDPGAAIGALLGSGVDLPAVLGHLRALSAIPVPAGDPGEFPGAEAWRAELVVPSPGGLRSRIGEEGWDLVNHLSALLAVAGAPGAGQGLVSLVARLVTETPGGVPVPGPLALPGTETSPVVIETPPVVPAHPRPASAGSHPAGTGSRASRRHRGA